MPTTPFFAAGAEPMPPQPVVSDVFSAPEHCVSPKRVRAFLRLSRIATDDTIREHLNELKGNKACDEYFASTIVPQWNARSRVIQYCSDYAAQLRAQSGNKQVEVDHRPSSPENPDPYNLRVDPYAIKNRDAVAQRQYAQVDEIERWVRNETTVETIIREETVKALNDRCYYRNWLDVFKK